MSYQNLEKTFYRLAQLNHAKSILSWDQHVTMPPKGNDARGRAMAELSVLSTEIFQNPSLVEEFAAAEQEKQQLEYWQQANLREMRRQWHQAIAIPKDLVEAEVIATNTCEHAWRSLRPANNWKDFEPLLDNVFQLTKEKSQILRETLNPERCYQNSYDALLDSYDPGTRTSAIDPIFGELKQKLPQLVAEATFKQQTMSPKAETLRPVSKTKQVAFARELMTILGFDFTAGRLDETAHPFSGGVSEDSRITSRYDENNALVGIMAIIHETGHSRYETGLRKAWRYKPVGKAMGMGVHESQSLFFEMQLGRSESFIGAITPLLRKHFGDDSAIASHNLHKLLTQVCPGLIRVAADELTYPLHVILRYEIESDIIAGKTQVGDIPERWNEAMQTFFGLDTAGNYRDGPMQDIHWPMGAIGYFPAYTIGALTAAQLFSAMIKDIPNVAENIARLDLTPIFAWLSRRIWQQGRLIDFDDMMTAATGETLSTKYFLKHLHNRYLR